MALLTRNTSGIAPAKYYQNDNTVGSGVLAGEPLAPGDIVYIQISDRKAYKAGGSGVTALTDEGANCFGMVFVTAGVGDAVTIMKNIDVAYCAKGVISNQLRLYVSTEKAGHFDTTPGIAGLKPCAVVVTDPVVTYLDGGTIHVLMTLQS